MILITLTLLLLALGCGTGDKMTAPRTTIDDIVSSGTGTNDAGSGGGGGGGGGGTGACIVNSWGCYEGVDEATCGYMSGVFHGGQTCATYGFTNCSIYGGYTICM